MRLLRSLGLRSHVIFTHAYQSNNQTNVNKQQSSTVINCFNPRQEINILGYFLDHKNWQPVGQVQFYKFSSTKWLIILTQSEPDSAIKPRMREIWILLHVLYLGSLQDQIWRCFDFSFREQLGKGVQQETTDVYELNKGLKLMHPNHRADLKIWELFSIHDIHTGKRTLGVRYSNHKMSQAKKYAKSLHIKVKE